MACSEAPDKLLFFIKPFEYKRIKKLYCCCYSTCIPGNLKREVESYLGLQMPVNSKHILIWFLCFSITFIYFFNFQLIFKQKKELTYNHKCSMKDNCLSNEALSGNMRINYFVMSLRHLCQTNCVNRCSVPISFR